MFANPEGTWTADQADGPVRTRGENGRWADIDTELVRVEGGYAPRNVPDGLVFSGGGDKVFAALEVDDHDLRFQWPTKLPTPMVEGDRATYRDAVDGGDLVVTATPTGFSHDIVLREAPQRATSFMVPVATGGPKLSEDKQGNLTVSTKSGQELVTADQPMMYDSSRNEVGDPEHVAQVDATVSQNTGVAGGGVLELQPDQDFLTDPRTQYPVTIDPSYTSYAYTDTWIQDPNYPSGNGGSPELRAGTFNGGVAKARSYIAFPYGPWQGQSVTLASLKLHNWYSQSCTGAAVRVWRLISGWSADTLTWSNQPSGASPTSESSRAYGATGCPAEDMSWDVTSTVQGWADGTYPKYGLRLTAADETNSSSWRRWRSADYGTEAQRPRLVVTYTNQAPDAPHDISVTPCLSDPCSSPLVLQGTRPTFRSTSADPNGTTWKMLVQIEPKGSTTTVYDDSVSGITNNQPGELQIPAGLLTSGTPYEYRIGAADGASTSWTGWTDMTTTPGLITGESFEPCAAPCTEPATAESLTPTFSGPITEDADATSLTYHLQIREAANSETVADATNEDPPSNGQWRIATPPDKLRVLTEYEYRVGAGNTTTTTWTTWKGFSTGDQPPATPEDIEISPCSPCTTPATTSSLRPSFTGTATDGDSRTLRYRVQVREQGNTGVVADTTGAPAAAGGEGTVRLDSSLDPGTAYEYRLAAVDANNTPTWSEGWIAFSTDGTNPDVTNIDAGTTISSDTTWTRAASPYVLTGGMHVAEGATLTLEPGVVVKTSGYAITVAGTLHASGTKAEPIVFTSVNDDSELGDSNGDGPATVPTPGITGTVIWFLDPSTDAQALARQTSVLRNVSIRYGGSGAGGGNACWGNAGGAIQYEQRTRLLMEHSEIINSYYNNMLPKVAGAYGNSGLDPRFASLTVRLSRFGATQSGCDVAQAGWGDYYGNVFESGTNLGGLWTGTGGVHASFEANWFLGCVCMNADYGNYPTRSTWNFEHNAFLGNFYNAWNTYPDDVSHNYWGPDTWTGMPQSAMQPTLANPPKWLNPGLESDPAPAPVIPLAQSFGSGSGEFGQVPYGYQADPVNSLNGSYHDTVTDASVPVLGIDLDVTRSYNSADDSTGSLGKGWIFAYDSALSFPTTQTVLFRAPDGQQMQFVRSGSSFVAPAGVTATLKQDSTGYTLSTRGETEYRFDLQGHLTRLKDEHENAVALTYDGNGHLATASNGPRSIAFTYTGTHLTQVTLPDSHTVSYGYTGDLLTSVTDQAQQVTSYEYTDDDKLKSETDPLQHVVMRLAYDAGSGRVSDQWDADNHHTVFAWDSATSTATMTDPRGSDWVDEYQGTSLVRRTDPEGRTWKYRRDNDLQLTSSTNPAEVTSYYDYDDDGNMVGYVGPSGPVSTEYDADHHPTSTVNARGLLTKMSYSAQGDLLSISRPPSGGSTERTVESFTYYSTGLLKSSTNADLKTTNYAYNTAGDLTTVTSPGGHVSTTTYEGGLSGMGRVATQQAPGKPTATSFTYDAVGRLKTVTDPLGRVVTDNAYDDAGQLVSSKDAKLRSTAYEYDDAGDLVTTTTPDPAADPLTSTYDANGNLATASDAEGRELSYTYNDANELTAVDGPQGHWEVSRTELGEIKTITAPDNTETKFAYTDANQVASIDYPGVSDLDVSYTYDPDGNRNTMTSGQGGTTSYAYDNLDQLTGVTRGSTSFGYQYTQAGLLKGLIYPQPSTTQVDYGYTDDGQLQTVKENNTLRATYGYSPSGALTAAAIGDGSGAFDRTYSYDDADRLTRLQDVKASSAAVLDDSFTYDDTDNPTQITHAGGAKDTYTYDIDDRLTGACYNTTTCNGASDYVKWTYDAVGNRTSEIRPSGTATYAYDATTGQLNSITGNGINRSFSYNDLGQVTNDGAATYTYNGAGQMASETRTGQTTTYNYDGDGQRLSAATLSSTTQYDWDPASHELLAELDGSGALTAEYLYGMGSLSRTTGAGAQSYYHVDAQGSVRALTTNQGVTTDTASYEPFGVLRASSPGEPTQPLGFAGQYTDAGGLQYLRARQYDPTTGRFAAPDPLGGPGAARTYSYANNNPMIAGDPSGLWPSLSSVASVVHAAAPIASAIGTVATIATFTPLAPIAGPVALAAGAVTAVDSMLNTVQDCIGGKGSCGKALLIGAAGAAVAAVGGAGGRLALKALRERRLLSAAKSADDFVDLASASRRSHILNGEVRPNGSFGGGHRPGTGFPNKSEFPAGWSDDKIMHSISDVATDPSLIWRVGNKPGDFFVNGTRGGIDIEVLIRNNQIWTGYPTNVIRNAP